MRDTSIEVISEWQIATFGDVPRSMVVARGMTELAEVICCDKRQDKLTEIADVWITVSCAAVKAGCLNVGLQNLVENSLKPDTLIPPPHLALGIVVDSLNNWQMFTLKSSLVNGFVKETNHELALVYELYWNLILLSRANGNSFDELLEAIMIKMEINRARTWVTKDGISQHV